MGIADRDYHRRDRPGESGVMSRLTPVVLFLLISNCAVYFVDLLLADSRGGRPFRDFGVFTIQSGIGEKRIWEFLTFQFLHADVFHLLVNMLPLFFFGPWLERWWGSRKFLAYYLICGVSGAVFYTLLASLGVLPNYDPRAPLLGASAGLFGILIGVAFIAPNLRVALLFPPIELSMRQLALALIAIASGSIILRLGGNEGGEAGHLGGAIVGFLIMRFPKLLGGGGGQILVQRVPKRQRSLPKLRPRTEMELRQDSAVDAILDKISREGFQSLTAEEREFLQKASQPK
jgi:membrane associated rhomboid family serine protease